MNTFDLTPNEAQDLLRQFGLHRTSVCIRLWCEDHPEFAIKRAGRWFIDRDRLLAWLHLDAEPASQQEAA